MNLLFVCTHNRCRSILCEAISNQLFGEDSDLKAYSAGSQPAGQVHPLSLRFLADRGFSIDGLRSHSWDDYQAMNPEIVITVCDSAAAEACPLWLGKGIKVHWGLPDPSAIRGSDQEVESAFHTVISIVESRIRALLDTNLQALSEEELKAVLNSVAQQHPLHTL